MIEKLQTRSLERTVRGFSCHRRIQIMGVLDVSNEAMTLTAIARACRTNEKPICEHVRRLHWSRLVSKQSRGREVLHELTPLGRKVVAFLRGVSS